MNIAFSFSSDWFNNWEISCFSLFYNNPKPITVYLLIDPLTDEQQKEINFLMQYFGNIHKIIRVDIKENIFTEENSSSHYTKYALYRLLLPNLLNEGKILYLDCDLIINQEIEDLYNTDLNNNILAAVIDKKVQSYALNQIGFKKETPYFNSGVLLLNLQKMRERKISELAIIMLNKKKYYYPDQSVLNVLAQDCFIPLSIIYNFSTATISPELGKIYHKDVKIFHYTGNKVDEDWWNRFPYGHMWIDYKEKLEQAKKEFIK